MKKIILIISCLFTCFCIYFMMLDDSNTIMGVQTINQNNIKSDLFVGREKSNIEIVLEYENEIIPYVKHMDVYLLSQSMDINNYQGRITNFQNYEMYIITPQFKKQEIIKNNIPLQIVVYNDKYYDIKNIIISGLPIVSLNQEFVDEDNYFGNMKIIDNSASGRKNVIEVNNIQCRYHYRGGSSLGSSKRSYKINLLDKKLKAKKKSLLNMRDDNDWILNPLYLDNSYMREKIGYDIWNNLSDKFQHQMKYVELIVDGNYQGIYCLQEPVDMKTFSTNKENSFLISIKNWADTIENKFLFNDNVIEQIYKNNMIVDEFEIESFKDDEIIKVIELIRVLKSNMNNSNYTCKYTLLYNRENHVDYGLFLDMTMAMDNNYKNQKISIKKTTKNTYTIYKTPWDLDISFLNENTSKWNPNISIHIIDRVYNNFSNDVFLPDMKIKYFQSRDKFYNEEYLHSLIDEYQNLLISSGAIQRESEKWPKRDFNESCQYLKDVISQRINALDEFYGGV